MCCDELMHAHAHPHIHTSLSVLVAGELPLQLCRISVHAAEQSFKQTQAAFSGVPHASDCDVCEKCLQTELPQIRFDHKEMGASDATTRLRKKLKLKTSSSHASHASEEERRLHDSASPRESLDFLPRPLWAWGDAMYAAAAQDGLQNSFAEVCGPYVGTHLHLLEPDWPAQLPREAGLNASIVCAGCGSLLQSLCPLS